MILLIIVYAFLLHCVIALSRCF